MGTFSFLVKSISVFLEYFYVEGIITKVDIQDLTLTFHKFDWLINSIRTENKIKK